MQILSEMFATQILAHPFINADPRLLEQCQVLSDQLGALYQAVGQAE